MSEENQAKTLHCGEYKIRVPLKALLDDTQVKTLVAALQRSYDDGTAGGFDITSTGPVSVVTFYREMSDDLGVIQDNIARNALKSREPEAVVVEQLAYELAEHQDESPIVQEIVTTMLERGAALLVEGDQAMVREEVGSVLKSGPQREMSNYIDHSVAETTLNIVEEVCRDFDGNGIFSVGAGAALRAMARHWKDHLHDGHKPRIISEDIDEMKNQLEVMRAEVMRRVSEHAPSPIDGKVQFNQPIGFSLGGFTVGNAATMTRCTAVGTIVGVEDRDGRRFVTIEFDEPQAVDVPEGATSKRFELTHTNITSTWAKSRDGRKKANYIEPPITATHELRSALNRYALADQDADAGLIWSVGGVWSASLLDQSPTLMTGPQADAFHKRHPNAHIIDVIVFREAHKAYTDGVNSVIDHKERSTPETRQAAHEAGIKALDRAGFSKHALDIVN